MDGVKTRTEVEAIAILLAGPKVVSLVDGTDAAALTRDKLQDMGFDIVLYAITALFAQARASAAAIEIYRSIGSHYITDATR